MANVSNELLEMLTNFTVCEIGAGALQGITYALLLKDNPKDVEAYKRYLNIVQESQKCGFRNNELFRVYEIGNGYIMDMDISTVKTITAIMAKKISDERAGKKIPTNLIGDRPEERRKKDIAALARYLKSEYDKGNTQLELALFSRNTTHKIRINGKGPRGEALVIEYNAYAIRHWDIELLNEKLLIPCGFRVCRIQPCEILPSKTGVSFMFTLEDVRDKVGMHRF